MKLILIRHTSVAVPWGVCYGQTDVALAATFPEEAAKVMAKLDTHAFDRVYTSPLSRCVKLAEFCGFPDAVRDPRLMEMNFGKWEMQPYDKIFDPHLQEWFDDYMNVAPTDGESAMEQRSRFLEFIDNLRKEVPEDASVALFTHGGILIHALNAFAGKSYEELFTAMPGYGSVIELNI
ncbi:MAG: alpha-ribazole phosphatase [Bacteroides sp.]|nr:alpha-ribazole phosphatase [Bacteroides sp.]